MAAETTELTGTVLNADQLCIGIFVMIDLPWFKHNFTLNSFKIRTEDQLRELRALKLAHYRYDAARSDAHAIAGLSAPQPAKTVMNAPVAETAPVSPFPEDEAQLVRRERILAQSKRMERVANVEKAFGKAASIMKNINRNLLARPKDTVEEIDGLVGQMIGAFLESPEATLHVMGDKAGGEEVYYHSLNVTILSMMLAKDMGLDVTTARDLGLGAMLHDVGLMEIPDRIVRKSPDEYNSAERSLRMQHVEYGGTIGTKLGLTPAAMAVVAQHHELADGSGYPKGLKGEQMTESARLVSLVNFYDNLCNPVDIKKAMTPHQALSFMFSQRRSKFDAKALQLLIRALGVYPPGSIVQLSTDALAMVTSVNPKKPLRPWVMIYDAEVPKEEAIMIDLEKETDINITKSIVPSLLSPKVAAYLNPRKRVTYFFDGAGADAGANAKA